MARRSVRPRPSRFALAVLALAASAWTHLRAARYYVAPTGDDAAPGSLARPFRSLERASKALKAGDTLFLRGGVYRAILYADASGVPGRPIVFRAYPGESPVLAGSDPAPGPWTRWRGPIWRGPPLPRATDVFVDGVELRGARWPAPAPAPDAPMEAGWAVAGPGTGPGILRDPALPKGVPAGARVRIAAGLSWVCRTAVVASSGPGYVRFKAPLGGRPAYVPRAGNRYFVSGALALLDGPGQWFQDQRDGRLYLWLADGGDPARHHVEIGRRTMVFYDRGRSHVRLEGLRTFCGGVKFSGCVGCVASGLRQLYVQHFDAVEGYDAPQQPTNGLYACDGCAWLDGSIRGSSGDGLAVSGNGDRVAGMCISDVDRSGGGGAAIALRGRGHVVEGNTLHDSGRSLIELGDTRGGRILRNEMFRAGLLTRDVGAVYSYGTDGAGTEIAYNDIHGVRSVRGIGVYLDNGDSGYVVDHNLIHGCAWAAVELNLPSIGNRVVANTLWGCPRWVWADGNPHSMTGTVIADNLVSGRRLLTRGRLAPRLEDDPRRLQPPPLFDPGGFRLAPGSLARARGVPVPPLTRGSRPDLGAFPYANAPWSAGCACPPEDFPDPFRPPRAGRRWFRWPW